MSERESPHPIYCGIGLEFLQPWDHLPGMRKIKELGLGNAVASIPVFHVGNSAEDRRQWKELYPSLAEFVDAVPPFLERPQYGMAVLPPMPLEFWLEELRLARELGLTYIYYPHLDPAVLSEEERKRVQEAAGGNILSYFIMGEATSMLGTARPYEQLKALSRPLALLLPGAVDDTPPAQLPPTVEEVNLQQLHDWYLRPYRRIAANARTLGVPYLTAIEATDQLRLAMEAGADCPILELTPAEPLSGLASTRGAAKAYRSPWWGVSTVLSYYQAPSNRWTPERLAIGYYTFFAGGASMLLEMNMALACWGLCSAFFTQQGSPPMRLGDAECREFDDPICARAREILTEFYRFSQFHQRPASGPRVKLGVVMGHLDGYLGEKQEYVWCVEDPAFAAGPAEATWRHFPRLFESEEWYIPPCKYYWQADPAKFRWHGTPPCGQVDIVPVEAPPDVLQSYGCLVFLGWNTMTPEQYAKLTAYVKNGGRLLMCLPHLSTQLRRDLPLELINDGDLTELFGVKVLGSGPVAEDVQIYAQSDHAPYELPVNTLYLEEAPLAKIELHGARVLAHPRELDDPVLVEHRIGEGFAWLLCTAEYPGARLDAFITDLLRTIAEGEQDGIALEGEMVDYAIYDGATREGQVLSTVYLVNKSIYGQVHTPRLHACGERIPLRVPGYDMRIAWVTDDLLISPFDKFVKVTDLRRTAEGFQIDLSAAVPGEYRLQLARRDGLRGGVMLNGEPVTVEEDRDGALIVTCRLGATNLLVIVTAT
jgi:hypothetical protein